MNNVVFVGRHVKEVPFPFVYVPVVQLWHLVLFLGGTYCDLREHVAGIRTVRL